MARGRSYLPTFASSRCRLDDAWMRDIGPTFVIDRKGGRRGVDWRFNAWGGLYSPFDRDERAAEKVLEIACEDRYRAPIVLEGGAIHVDGEGTVLTTEECLLNENRNPGLSRQEIEQVLLDHLGAELVIWLGRGLCGDETDGHIDNLACFAAPGVVLLNWCDDENDPQHEVAVDAERRLGRARDAEGRAFEIVRVPCPPPMTITDTEARGVYEVLGTHPRRPGDRMAASYVNFYVGNRRVVFPLLDESTDETAREILEGVFGGREIIGLPSREILLGGGNIHCITQQVPRTAIDDRLVDTLICARAARIERQFRGRASGAGERAHEAEEGLAGERPAGGALDELGRVAPAPEAVNVLAEPALDVVYFAAPQAFVERTEVTHHRLPELRGDHTADRVRREVTEAPGAPVHVLHAAFGVGRDRRVRVAPASLRARPRADRPAAAHLRSSRARAGSAGRRAVGMRRGRRRPGSARPGRGSRRREIRWR